MDVQFSNPCNLTYTIIPRSVNSEGFFLFLMRHLLNYLAV